MKPFKYQLEFSSELVVFLIVAVVCALCGKWKAFIAMVSLVLGDVICHAVSQYLEYRRDTHE